MKTGAERRRTQAWAGRALLVVAGCLLAAGCAGTGETAPKPTPPADRGTHRDTPRAISGYRVQIFTTPKKAEADAEVERALAWWRGVPVPERPSVLSDADLPVYIDWRQPYYRVRIGDFAGRAEAQRALDFIAEQYPDAFVVPDLVTLAANLRGR